jgi:hypothetical protein
MYQAKAQVVVKTEGTTVVASTSWNIYAWRDLKRHFILLELLCVLVQYNTIMIFMKDEFYNLSDHNANKFIICFTAVCNFPINHHPSVQNHVAKQSSVIGMHIFSSILFICFRLNLFTYIVVDDLL